MNDALIGDLKAVFRKHMSDDMGEETIADLHLQGLEWLMLSLMCMGVPADAVRASIARAVEAVRRSQN
jgi:hypothetical protein